MRERRVVKHSDAELTLLNHINVMYKSSIVTSSYFSIVNITVLQLFTVMVMLIIKMFIFFSSFLFSV